MSDRSQLNMRVAGGWIERVRAAAERDGLTVSAYVIAAVNDKMRATGRE